MVFAAARRRGDRVKRRDFITLLGGAAVAWAARGARAAAGDSSDWVSQQPISTGHKQTDRFVRSRIERDRVRRRPRCHCRDAHGGRPI